MKNTLGLSLFSLMLTGMMCIAPPSLAATAECEDVYFSPDDHNHERSLPQPHLELAKSIKRAKAGNAMEQRNVAVSFEAGYLVNACREKARYWYEKAAQNGDQIAQEWITRDNRLQAIHDGPEFIFVDGIESVKAMQNDNKPRTAATYQLRPSYLGLDQSTYAGPMQLSNDPRANEIMNQPDIQAPSSGSGRNVGQCMGACGSEQGMCSANCNDGQCIANCNGNGQCIGNCGSRQGMCSGNCAAAHGRCVARCN